MENNVHPVDTAISSLKKALRPVGESFINEVIASLAQPKQGIYGYLGATKENVFAQRKVQRELVQSTKYFVDSNLLAHAVHGSWVNPKKLYQAMQMAIPPSNNMWIEWNEDLRKKHLKKCMQKNMPHFEYELDDDTPVVGYHITKRSDNPFTDIGGATPYKKNAGVVTLEKGLQNFDRFCFQGYTRDKTSGKVIPLTVGFMLYDHAINYTVLPDKQDQNQFLKSNKRMIGEQYIECWNGRGENTDFLTTSTFMYLGQLASMSFSQEQIHTMFSDDGLSTLAGIADIVETQIGGDLRFLISLIALLNYPLVTTETVTTPQQITTTRWGRKLPKNEYKVVDINLPKPRGIRIYNQMFTGHGAPKRQHVRRGHWRITRGLDGTVRQKWIEEQIVGNPEIGVIVKDYNLKAKGGNND